MQNRQYDNDEFERMLDSLRRIRRAEPKAYFHVRLEARMKQRFARKTGWQWRPAYALAALGLVLVLNLATLYTFTHAPTPAVSAAESFAGEYGFDDVSSLDAN